MIPFVCGGVSGERGMRVQLSVQSAKQCINSVLCLLMQLWKLRIIIAIGFEKRENKESNLYFTICCLVHVRPNKL